MEKKLFDDEAIHRWVHFDKASLVTLLIFISLFTRQPLNAHLPTTSLIESMLYSHFNRLSKLHLAHLHLLNVLIVH